MQKLMKLAGQLCLAAAVFFAFAIPLKFLLKIYIYSWFDIPPDSDIGVGGIHIFSAIVGCYGVGLFSDGLDSRAV